MNGSGPPGETCETAATGAPRRYARRAWWALVKYLLAPAPALAGWLLAVFYRDKHARVAPYASAHYLLEYLATSAEMIGLLVSGLLLLSMLLFDAQRWWRRREETKALARFLEEERQRGCP